MVYVLFVSFQILLVNPARLAKNKLDHIPPHRKTLRHMKFHHIENHSIEKISIENLHIEKT